MLRTYAAIITLALVAALSNPTAEKHYAELARVYPWVEESLTLTAEAKYEIFSGLNEPVVGCADDTPPALVYNDFRLFSWVEGETRFPASDVPAPRRTLSLGILGYVWVKPPSPKFRQRMEEDAVEKKIMDPDAEFFAAYQTCQQAERLTAEGNGEQATEKLRGALRTMEQVRAQYPDWQPMVVDFRMKKIREALAKLPEGGSDVCY